MAGKREITFEIDSEFFDGLKRETGLDDADLVNAALRALVEAAERAKQPSSPSPP